MDFFSIAFYKFQQLKHDTIRIKEIRNKLCSYYNISVSSKENLSFPDDFIKNTLVFDFSLKFKKSLYSPRNII